MLLIIVLIFVGVFAIMTPLLIAWSGSGSRQNKQTIATLDTASGNIVAETPAPVIDVRKSERASGIPWLNRKLGNINVVPALQRMLSQADMKSTAGALILMCLASFAVPSYFLN